MSEVAKGFRQRRFFDLSDRDKRDILKLMARVAEQAYRRGVQQGAGLAGKSSFRGDLWEWRYRPSLELGQMLYFDPRLSQSHNISCNTCHQIGLGGDDGLPTSIGHKWQKGGRNARPY